MHHGRFDRGLQREGKITMTVVDGLVQLAPRTERFREPLLERLLDAVGVVADQVPIDRKSSLGLKAHQLAELICVGRPAGAGERHHGPFRERLEPQIGSRRRIEKAEGVEDLAVPQALEAIAGADIGGLGGLVAMAVHHQHGGLLEGRREEDRRMRVVMLDLHDLQQLLVYAEVATSVPI